MKVHQLNEMTKGWFIGNFEPSLHKTSDVEVAVKQFSAGDYEFAHYHKIATEYTVVLFGDIEMNGSRFTAGNIIEVPPNYTTDFRALTDVTTVVVKIPCVNNDKYLV